MLENRPSRPDSVRYAAIALFLASINGSTSSAQEAPLDTRFSIDRGFYETPFTVVLSSDPPGATLRYTLDGSAPTIESGTLYVEPIEVTTTTTLRAIAFEPGGAQSNVDTHTYIFLEDVVRQPEQPAEFPSVWSTSTSDVSSAGPDYGMDANVVDSPRYGPRLRGALLDLPAVSIVMDRDELFGTSGIYHRGGSGQNSGLERAASVEMIWPDARLGFQIDCGIRPHSHARLKRFFKLLFKAEYGEYKLRYPLFANAEFHGDSAVDSFDRLILRAGNNRGWTNRWNPDDTCFTRDQWIRDTQLEMSGVGARGIFVHLWLNGLYWGLYNLTERPDAWFHSAYFGGEKEDWYAINHGGSVSGNAARYDRLRQLASQGGLDDPLRYAEMRDLIDVDLFSDYLILNWFAGVGDWPQNNWYGGNRNLPVGPFRYFSWDAEDCFDALGSGRRGRSNDGAWVQSDFRRGSSSTRPMAVVWRALRENPEFLLGFADRVRRHTAPGGALSDESCRERWARLNTRIEEAVIAESARWGDSREEFGEPLRTLDESWRPEVERVSRESFEANGDRLIAALRSDAYYPGLDAPDITPPGGRVLATDLVTISTPANAAVWATVNGDDPRDAATNAPSVSAFRYEDPLPLERSTLLRARAVSGSIWSAETRGSFWQYQDLVKLRVTEILYHQRDIAEMSGDAFEFVELMNTGDGPLDLSGVRFRRGIEFEFPLGTVLAPGAFCVLAADAAAFNELYLGREIEVSGVYRGKLSNAGETLQLADPLGEVFFEVTWDDEPPWPVEADGDGNSLVPLASRPVTAPDRPEYWKSSAELLGSPGQSEGEDLPSLPVVHRAPRSQSVLAGDRVILRVAALGSPQPSYQWERDGQPIPGADTWMLVLPELSLRDDGARFRCVVSNVHGTVSAGPAVLRVDARPVSGDFVGSSTEWRWIPGLEEPSDPIQAWRQTDFDDSDWAEGRTPFGYGDEPFGTLLDDMRESYSALFLRRGFVLPTDLELTELEFAVDFDDGFVAWIDGLEVARRGVAPVEPGASTFAAPSHESGVWELHDLGAWIDSLEPGPHTLAVAAFNVSLSSSDFKIDAALRFAGRPRSPTPEPVFLRGDGNLDGRIDISDAIDTLLHLFAGDNSLACDDARDVDDSGSLEITDAVRTLAYLFQGGEPPAAPYPVAGPDPTDDALGCELAELPRA